MSCEWRDKVDAYLDNELSEQDDLAMSRHLQSCQDCAAAALGSRKLKLSIKRAASGAFAPSAEFQLKIRKATAPHSSSMPSWLPGFALAGIAVIVVVAALGPWLRPHHQDLFAEITDLHVSTLASANPIDVISTDRHTVKPWFEGKLPFTFDLPEFQNSDFHLVGGRVAYVSQSPAAQLLFGIRKHQISGFIFQERQRFNALSDNPKDSEVLAFNLETWSDHGLRYVLISDASSADVRSLGQLLRSAKP
jgi:anti-sigma factor RsiW